MLDTLPNGNVMNWAFFIFMELTLLVILAIVLMFCSRFLDKLGAIEDYMMQLPDRLPESRCNFPAETEEDKPFVQTAPQWGDDSPPDKG